MYSGLKSIHFNIRESIFLKIFLNPFQFISIHSRLLGAITTKALQQKVLKILKILNKKILHEILHKMLHYYIILSLYFNNI